MKARVIAAILTVMPDAAKFIRRGMFPKELPPNFTTSTFAKALGANATPPLKRNSWAYLCHHSLARSSGVRRTLGLPNPIPQYHLAKVIAANWKTIRTLIRNRSPDGLSRPTLQPKNRRAAGPALSGEQIPLRRARLRSRGRFLVRGDVAEFYRSAYSHALPWAVFGKEAAKARLRARTKGWPEKLDEALRPTVHGQTNGIPIGPDTSFVIGELLLSGVDDLVRNAVPGARGFRFFDDYEFVAESQAEAEDILGALQDALATLDLLLNQRKTEIVELPRRMSSGTEWMHDFPPHALSERKLIDFFERVFEARRSAPESSVIGYAMSRVANITIRTDSMWNLAQDLMGQGISVDAGAMHQYVRALVRLYVDSQRSPDAERLGAVLDLAVRTHAPRGHASEVAWCIWAAMAFQAQLSAEATADVSRMEDDVVALLALEANGRGVFQGTLDTSIWEGWMVDHQLYGDHWLVAYEALGRGFLPAENGVDYVAADVDGFRWLKSQNVRFTTRFRRPSQATLEDIRPTIGARYDDEWDEDF